MTDVLPAGVATEAPPLKEIITDALADAAAQAERRVGETPGFDLETGLDLVCDSLSVLTNLLGCARGTAINNSELGNMLWLIEEKAQAVRRAILSQISADAALLRQLRADAARPAEG